MATGIPKKKHKPVSRIQLVYEGKKATHEIITGAIKPFKSVYSFSSKNRLYFGDNIDVLRLLLSDPEVCGKVDLIYIDPPFATQSKFVSRKLSKAYEDLLTGADYVEFLRERLVLLHKLLSDTGSIYVHLDENMVFEIKIIMDEIFGRSNYRNIIIRKKCNPKNYTRKSYGNIADFILFYTKSSKYTWNKPTTPLSEESKKEYRYIEEGTGRRYMKVPLHAPGIRNGETGKPWRGILPPPGKHWQYPPSKLDEMDARGEIYWSKNGNPRRKVYLDEHPGVGVQDIWLEFPDAHNQNIKITGYPTEKNPDLLKRIIAASSNPGDLVLDCFVGSGTTISVAAEMQRNWIGIDNSIEAIKTILDRFTNGLKPMGDYVANKLKRKRMKPQRSLFESLEVNISHNRTDIQSNPNPVLNFSIFIPVDASPQIESVINEWKHSIGIKTSMKEGIYSLSDNLTTYKDAIEYLRKNDAVLANIIDEAGPCKLMKSKLTFELIVDAIISQQLSKKASDSIIDKFKKYFQNTPITPEEFLKKSASEIKKLGISSRKYEYIYDLATKINNGSLNLDRITDMDNHDIRTILKKIKGVGDWTVDMILLFGLGREDVFPFNDLALRQIISTVYDISKNDVNNIIEFAKRWKPYRGIASWYLYKYRNKLA